MAEWKNPETITLWLTAGILFIVVLLFSIIFFTRLYFKKIIAEQKKLASTKLNHQKELLEASVKIQEKERNRIASDLHDDLIGKLNVLLLSDYLDSKSKGSTLLRTAIDTARRISHELSPPLLENINLSDLIINFLDPIQNRYRITFINSSPKYYFLTTEKKLQLFRIVQEVLNNTIKHANADSIFLHLRLSLKYSALLISDNGQGFNGKNSSNGLGLKNIESRSQILKAKFKYKPNNPTGVKFFLLFESDQKLEK